MAQNSLTRFLGGSPFAVLLKLLVLSLIVGALLHFAGLTPESLFRSLWRMVVEIIGTGWDALGTIGRFIVYGAMIVVPIFIVTRLLARR